MKKFLAEKLIYVVDHPPYLPDRAPCDYNVFSNVKSALHGIHLVCWAYKLRGFKNNII